MKKLLLLIPFTLIGCVSPQDQSRNLEYMRAIQANQPPQQSQGYYQPTPKVQPQGGSETYSVTDEKGDTSVYKIKKDPYSLGSPTGR